MSSNFNKDLYKILNISFDASNDEIKAAYRKLVRLYHPDVAGDSADEYKFKEIQNAYEVLINENERKKYDLVHGFYKEKLKKDIEKKQQEAQKKYDEKIKQAKEKSEQQKQTQSQTEEENNDFTQSVDDALDSLFNLKGRKNSKKQQQPKPQSINGTDIYIEVKINTMEALEGTTRKVNILHTEPCPKCGGHKFINSAQCENCNGTGQIQNQKKINVQIPCGVKKGSKVRVKNEGNKGQNGGKDGDLYLVIDVEKSKFFNTDGRDIFITLPITVPEAALGADIPVKILKDTINVKIPPLTSSGQKLKLSGLGIENKTGKGDIIITVQIKMPDKLSINEKTLYEKLKYYTTFDVRKDFNNAK